MKQHSKLKRAWARLCAAALTAATLVSLAVLPASAAGEEVKVQTTTFDMSYDHAGLIDTDGALWMWGESYYGQLGNNFGYDMKYIPDNALDAITYQCGPVKVMEDVASIALGNDYTAALKTDGSLWTWGDNQYGQLGNGYNKEAANFHSPCVQGTPGKIMDNVAQIEAGYDVMAAIKTDGSLWMWGSADDGVLGNGGTGNRDDRYSGLIQTVPVKILEDVAAVSVGFRFSAAIKTDGSLWMWGSNKYGQIRQGGAETIVRPVKVMDGVAAVKVDGGSYDCAVMVIKTDGSLWLWGTNENGRLLPGGAEIITEPTRFMENVAGVDIDSGGCAALREDGTLWTWGARQNGTTERTGLSKVMNGVAAVRMGTSCYGVLKTDGTVWMWGNVGILAGIAVENNDNSIRDIKSDTPIQVPGLVGRLPQDRSIATAPFPDQSQTIQTNIPAVPISFSDVKDGDWFAPYVTELVSMGGVNGYPDGTFRPNDNISRIEAYAIAIRLFPSSPVGGDESLLAQAQRNDGFWGKEQIIHALKNSMDEFGADPAQWSLPATREELAWIFYRAYISWYQEQGGGDLPCYAEAYALIGDYAENVAFSDYEPCIVWLYSYGIVTGINENGDFAPKANATRAECSTMLVSLYHSERWEQHDWNAISSDLQQAKGRQADGTDFTGAARMHYTQDVAYYYCRALEEEIGIQIFYLPEWTPKEAGLLQHSDFDSVTLDGYYFIHVLDELRKMKEAYDLYPEGFLKEVVNRKNGHKTEIILCPYTFEGVSSYGLHVYDDSSDAVKVDQIYYTGTGDSQYYSHEMGHMIMSSAAILNGWNTTVNKWESLSTSGNSFVSLYAMSSRAEDWAETWAYLWHQTDLVLQRCGDSGMKAKVQYLTQLLDQYSTVDVSALPWASVPQSS